METKNVRRKTKNTNEKTKEQRVKRTKNEIVATAAPVTPTPETLQEVPATRKAELIALGEDYGSEKTLAQADASLNALANHAPALEPFGFVAADTAKLTTARDALLAAGVTRQGVVATNKTTTEDYQRALVEAKSARKVARAVLSNVKRALGESQDEHAAVAKTRVTQTLAKTTATNADRKKLATQTDDLLDTLLDPVVAAAAATRGGPDVVAKLQEVKAKLRTTKQTKTRPRGTPKETQLLDFFDGVIVELTRNARTAAVAASNATGNPALAKEFELTHLYRSTGRRKKAGEEGDGTGDVGTPNAAPVAVATTAAVKS